MLAEAKSQMSSSGEIRAKLTPFVLNRVVATRGKGDEHGQKRLEEACFFLAVRALL